MGTLLGPKYIPYTYMDPLGWASGSGGWEEVRVLLGGPWDLVTIYNWGYNPTYTWGNSYEPI